jgi:transposase-like protein
MKRERKSLILKRTPKDYSMSFKLSVVQEIESGTIGINAAQRKYGIQGHGTISEWRRKYGKFASENTLTKKVMPSPQQRIMELEQQLRLLQRENKFLAEQLIETEDKAAILDRLIDIAEKEYILPIRKNSCPGQSKK